MDIDTQALARRFAELSDEALLQRLHSGGLTPAAQQAAEDELAARGLPLSGEAPSAADTEAEAEQASANPYRAPRARVASTATTGGGWAALFWWLYIGYIVLLIGAGSLRAVGATPDPRNLVGLLLNAWALVGLIGWRLRRPLLHPLLWVACLAVATAQYAFSVLRFGRLVLPRFETAMASPLFLVVVFLLVAGLPLLWGLLRYAFFSAPLWQARKGRDSGI